MKRSHIAAVVVAIGFLLWLGSGQLGDTGDEDTVAPPLAEARDAMLAMDQDAPVSVRARRIPATEQAREVVVRGRTEVDRAVDVRAETNGRVVELPVDKGAFVDAGDLLCRIAVDARPARIDEAEQAVAQARIEYQGAQRLAERGLQSETAIAASRARLAAAEANLADRRLDLERTAIRAPFAGVVERRPVEIGDVLQSGSICANVVDPDPMMVVGEVAERDVGALRLGEEGRASLITGQTVEGRVAFVARTANPTTRTFRVELAVPNPDADLRDGITAELRLPVERFPAHRVPSSILALDDAGDLGVRILDDDDIVRFVNVEVLKDDTQGIWVTGLPDPATVITVGQELVIPGQQVDVTLEAGASMPTAAPERSPAGNGGDDVARPAESAPPEVGALATVAPARAA